MADQNGLIPVKLDAFIFNKPVCNSGVDKAKIAPITQPNYSFLRLGEGYLQSDIMHHVDLHNAWPADRNSRFTDLGTFKPFRKRQGVYLHWTMPLVYRSGLPNTSAPSKTPSSELPGITSAESDPTVPIFPDAPARWLVVRKIDDMESIQPPEARDHFKRVTAWVIESDRKWQLDELGEDVDLQVDVSPFIYAKSDENTPGEKPISLDEQAEIFIGEKIPLESWKEVGLGKDRIDLKLLGSSNQLFADYQPHCSNVFSMLDNFEYNTDYGTQYLEQAQASYYVMGWNWRESKDIFHFEKNNKASRCDKISQMNMEIKGLKGSSKVPDAMQKWLDSTDSSRTICHGAIYCVKWDTAKPPKNIPGDKYAALLNGTLPVAVGTTPLDALTTYADSHKDIEKEGTPKRLETIISKLERYLLARDDGVETQFEAADLLYNWNYLRLEGGQRYYISGDSKTESDSGIPTETLTALAELNRSQAFFDAISRRIKQLRWLMFSEWWKYCILPSPTTDMKKATRDEVTRIDLLIENLQTKAAEINKAILEYKTSNPSFLPGTRPTYYQQRDPTLLVGGVKSGWQPDFLESLQFRLDSQVLGSDWKGPITSHEDWRGLISVANEKLPEEVRDSAKALIHEFAFLDNQRVNAPSGSSEKQPPLFHDQLEVDKDENKKPILGPWRDLWNDTQPWFPLFLEWEVDYVHLPYDKYWALEEHKLSHDVATKLHYKIKDGQDLADDFKNIKLEDRDDRSLSGRVLILPQPSFSLEAKVKQFFDDTPALPDCGLDSGDEAFIKSKLRQLGFISAPLAGFTSHLITIEQGNHVKPILKVPQTGELKVIPEATRGGVGLTDARLARIGIESDVTPYGSSKKTPSTDNSTFKPVTHGQFKFAKLNIIDKFGQAITVINQRPSLTRPKVWPCISDWYKPHTVEGKGDLPNIIERDEEYPYSCEFIQVPPSINQPTRLNGAYVVPREELKEAYSYQNRISLCNDDLPFWRPMNEWDEPIWGWVVVNYANNGIQIFLPDGTFYREIRLGGQNRSVTSPEWIPFKKPENPKNVLDPKVLQLALLVEKLGNNTYLKEFVGMINAATVQLQSPPSSYAEFTSSLIGRPLALVNMAWSLELASNELSSQLAGDNEPEKYLLASPNEYPPKSQRKTYKFSFKLGDKERGFDGLVGYFNGKAPGACKLGDALDLGKFYSHYSPNDLVPTGEEPQKDFTFLKTIGKANYPSLESFYIDPSSVDAEGYETAFNRQMSQHAFGALMDPFSPIHAYSGILPVKEITLPNWTWQTAIEKMKAFFHAGPVLVVKDVPNFDPDKELTADQPVTKVTKNDKNEIGVQLPSVSGNQWAWLQPYMVKNKANPAERVRDYGEPKLEAEEKYMALTIDNMDQESRLEGGPYTAIEGYLQLADPPKKDQVKK
ncbi:hypothetical protein TWF569_008602 [Orbilia oligospora]|nr:hypothetical protein TWF569_008602 [Orbilia oligospora]